MSGQIKTNNLPVASPSDGVKVLGLDKQGQTVQLPFVDAASKTELATIGAKVGGLDSDKETGTLYITDKDGKVIAKFDASGLSATALKVLENGNLTDILTLLAAKVDAVSGKSLSTNDYTTAEKTKVATIENKVDKVDGKGLSTNDFTTTLKNKLDGIQPLNSISEGNDSAFYVVDASGNIVAKVDSNGLSATSIKFLYDGELKDLSDILTNLPSGSSIDDILADKITNSLVICDNLGNVIAKFDAEGLHVTNIEGAVTPRYKNKSFIAIGDSHTQRYAKWLPIVAKRSGGYVDTTLQGYIIGDKGANLCASGYADCVYSMLSQAKRLVEQVQDSKTVDVVIIENVHYDKSSQTADTAIPFKPTTAMSIGEMSQPSTNESSWFSTNFDTIVASITPTIGTLVKSKWNNKKYKIEFSGTPTANSVLILSIDGYDFQQPIASGDTLANVISGLNSWDFAQYTDWANEVDGNNIILTYKGSGEIPTPSVTINTSSCGISVTLSEIDSYKTIYRRFRSRNIEEWNDATKWTTVSNFGQAHDSILGLIEYLSENLPNCEIICLGLSDFSPSSTLVSTITDGIGINATKWKSQSNYKASERKKSVIKESAEYSNVKYIDVDKLSGINPQNWTTFYNYGDVHPKAAGYTRWAETIIRELGI